MKDQAGSIVQHSLSGITCDGERKAWDGEESSDSKIYVFFVLEKKNSKLKKFFFAI